MASQVHPDEEMLKTDKTQINELNEEDQLKTKGKSQHQKKRGTVQLPDEIEENVNSFSQLAAILISIMSGSLSLGYSFGYMTVSFSSVFDSITLRGSVTAEQGLFSAVLPIGQLVGSLLTTFLIRSVTRNQALIIADLCGVISVLSTIPVREVILTFRFVFGVCNGISCIIMPIYVKELCPDRYFDKFSVVAGFKIGIGLLFAYVMGLGYLNPDLRGEGSHWWQVMFAIPAIISFFRLTVVTLIYQMDSPISLLDKGKEKETKDLLAKIYKPNCVDQAFKKCKLRLQYNQEHMEGFQALFSKKHRDTVAIGCLLMFMYTWCGIFAVFSYSSQFFGLLIGDNLTLNTIFSLILGISQHLPVYISGWLYGRYGKRTLLLAGMVLIMLFQIIIIGLSYTDSFEAAIVNFIVICLFAFSYAATLSPICWGMTPEINNSDGTQFCIIQCWGWQLFMLYIYPFMLEGMGVGGSFILFIALTFLSTLFFYFTVKETKGLNHNQIDELYRKL